MKLDYDLIKQIMIAPEQDFAAVKGITNLGTQNAPLYYLDRGSNILGVAHMDSVVYGNCHIVETAKQQRMIVSPMCDDRVGVAVLLAILPKMGVKCDILLSTNEEIMQPTSSEFNPDKQYNWMFMFDRSGIDAVTYQYNTKTWKAELGRHFTIGRGSYSDIADMDHLGCCGVNIGTGYYLQHTAYSYTIVGELLTNLSRFAAFYHKNKEVFYKYEQELCESCGNPLSRYGYCLHCKTSRYLPSVTHGNVYDYTNYADDDYSWHKNEAGVWIKSKKPAQEKFGCCVLCYTKPQSDLEREHLNHYKGMCEECRNEVTCKICGRHPLDPEAYRFIQKWGYCETCNYETDL